MLYEALSSGGVPEGFQSEDDWDYLTRMAGGGAVKKTGDPVKDMAAQILAQGTSSKWSGEGGGSKETNALWMAHQLSKAGLTDINDFGLVTTPKDVSVTPVYEYDYVQGSDGETVRRDKVVGYTGPDGKPVDPSLVKTQDTYSGEGDAGTPGVAYVAPLGTQKVYGNVKTGQVLDPGYDRANKDRGIWSGTFAGKDSTHYGVQFKDDGTPIFYTQQGESTNDLAQLMQDPIIGAVLQVGASYFGGPLGTAALNAASGKDLKDVAKATALSYLGGKVGNFVSGSEGVVDTLGKTGANIAGKVAGSVATGKDPVQALISGGLDVALPEITNLIPGYGEMDSFQQELVNRAVVSTLKNNKLDPASLVKAATSAGSDAAKTAMNSNPDSSDTDANIGADTNTAGTNTAATNTDLSQLLGTLGSGAQAPTPPAVQENSADVQLMEELFGPSLFTQAGDDGKRRFSQGGDVDTLLQLLRG